MSTTPSLDSARFAKVRALHDSTDHPGERKAAAGRMEVMARAAGLTVDEALTALDAPSPRQHSSKSTFANMFSDIIAEHERERTERWRQVLTEYGSEEAVFEPCAWEHALERVCAPFRVRRSTTGWPLGSLWGWHLGTVGDPAPQIIETVSNAYPMPATVREAWAEYTFWEKLAGDREARGVGMGGHAPGVVIRVRLLESLLKTLPAHSLNDLRARLSWIEYLSNHEIDQDVEDHRVTLVALRADVERMAARIPRNGGEAA